MKPFSILLSIALGLISLSFIVWIGKFGAAIPKTPDEIKKEPASSAEDLPLPKTGPYGKAEIEETDFNFGTKMVGTNDQHTFTIKNVGEGNLDFKLGKATCQCTGVEISRPDGEAYADGVGSIKPGESVLVLIKWQMKAKLEKFRHGAPVYVTDPARRKIDLHVMGAVDGPFDIQPPGRWEIGEILPNEPSKVTGVVTSKVCEEFTLVEESRDDAHVKVTWEPLPIEELQPHKMKSGYKIICEVSPDIPVGLFTEIIKLKATAASTEQNVEFAIGGRRSGPIDVRGVTGGAGFNMGSNRLVFQDFAAAEGKTVKMTVFVKGGADHDLVLEGVEPADTRFKVKLENGKVLGKTKSYQLVVEIPPGHYGLHRGTEAETINLKLNHPDAPDFKLVLDYNATH